MIRRSRLLALLALATLALGAQRCPGIFLTTEIVVLGAGPDLEFRLREAVIQARPGTVIELPPGTFDFRGTITVEESNIMIRGAGMDVTVLDYSGQVSGSQGILGRGDDFVVRDFTILDPAGDGVKTEFVNRASFINLKVEWTRGPHPDNGDYGIYPALNENVLIDGCVVIGARDAGIYLGQSTNSIVRNNLVQHNVLGIEIENTIRADVYGNTAVNNTGGIAAFNLPNLIVDGHTNRVFDNEVHDNDTPNFAAGGILRSVPGGTGIISIGSKDLEIFGNHVTGNDTVNIIASSFLIAMEPINDQSYDPYSEGVHIYDNVLADGGSAPQGNELGFLIGVIFGAAQVPVPDILLGGYVDPAKIPGFDPAIVPPTLQVLPERRMCVHDNVAPMGYANLNQLNPPIYVYDSPVLPPSHDPSPHDCVLPPIDPVVLPPNGSTLPSREPVPTPEEIAALCEAPGAGVNWDAFVVDCPKLSHYRLHPAGPLGEPADPGIPYDLTTPLFSDYAHKERVLFLPPGTQAGYRSQDVFDLPVGSIISKTFWFETPGGGTQVVETRLLIHREKGWDGLPYIWDVGLGDADLSIGGGVANLTLLDEDGIEKTTDYEIPSSADCGGCHFAEGGDVPIGPKARLLNRDFDYAGGTQNQLDHWTAIGALAGAPASAAAPRLPVWNDPATGSLEERARAYLESNCAHCHTPLGRAGFSGLWLDHDAPLDVQYGLCKRPVAAGSGALGLDFDIVPGDSAASIAIGRMSSTVAAIKMPELSKSLVHVGGTQLVADWIDSLPGDCEASP